MTTTIYRKKAVKETVIEKYFKDQIEKIFPSAQVHKYTPRRGEPDRICLLPGARTIFVELKRPGKEPRPEQHRALERLRQLGFEACWLDTREKIDDFIQELII